MAWWDSLECIARIHFWLNIVVVVSTVIAALAGVVVLIISTRMATLQAAREAALQTQITAVSPRTLTPTQREQLVTALRAGPSGPVLCSVPVGDAEALSFAGALHAAVTEAGWPTAPIAVENYIVSILGLRLEVLSVQDAPDHTLAFQKAMDSIAIDARAYETPGLGPEVIQLVVGHKPVKRS
jgi:uncharacterized iron-regulated membrane protein